MRVIAPYNKREKRSQRALEKYAPTATWIDTSSSIYAYGEAVASYWTGEDDLVVIESDKEITAEVIPSFALCDSYWCSYSYYVFPPTYQREVSIGLGCARYSVLAQQTITVDEFICEDDWRFSPCAFCNGKGCWMHLDSRIAQALRSHAVNVCCHGRISHHHDYGLLDMTTASEVFEANINRSKSLAGLLPTDLFGPSWLIRQMTINHYRNKSTI